ncbi:hypothetical protein HMF7854_10845 [Sphingomonas ginkgonis]|uniref:Uncharacterized protein n=1 Tax=Sphingomonas ginkgonis TaxID=2315330 RepID=A0A3R9WQW4_9SPHN|nr:hypothetical protein [Sphingomonas ginkgonis]RST31276.1 hypothetical protein HMF7854_10845 [Sphingomonas ginkgonis]
MSDLARLTEALQDPAPDRHRVAGWRLVLGLVLAPTSFLLQIVGSYIVTVHLCDLGGDPRPWTFGINAIAVAGALAGIWFAWHAFQATRHERGGGARKSLDTGEGRTRFIAACGFAESGIMLLAVVLGLTSVLTLSQCLVVR